MLKKISILILFISIIQSGFSQELCKSTLEKASRLYDQGMIDEIPQLLGPCIENGFTRVQKIEAYKLVILSYLFDDDQYEAENTLIEFLKKYPEYEIMPNDPVEFIYLFESYKTHSVFSLNIYIGPNLSLPRIIEPYSAVTDESDSYKRPGMGFQAGIGISRGISRYMDINVDVFFANYRYVFKQDIRFNYGGFYTDQSDEIKTKHTEKLNKIDVPVSVTYNIGHGNMKYYFRSGLGLSYITKVNVISEFNLLTSPDTDFSEFRKSPMFFGIVGGGIKYKVPRGYLVIDGRINIGLNNIVNSEKRFDNQEAMYNYLYLDDDFTLNSINFTIGYHFSLYQPRKQR
jgi:hypothetical protein